MTSLNLSLKSAVPSLEGAADALGNPQMPKSLSVLTRIAKLAIHVRLTCASSLSGLRAKPTYTCAFTIADVSFLESELKKALDLTNLSLPSCLGAHE
ncbi:hypothetical protein Tco_0038859 [Tanacetum coccineum]